MSAVIPANISVINWKTSDQYHTTIKWKKQEVPENIIIIMWDQGKYPFDTSTAPHLIPIIFQ